MTAKSEFGTPSASEISFVRHFPYDLNLIWAVWTQAEHLRHWWGPKGWTTTVCEVDFRPGGAWFYCMENPEGERHCGKLIYGDIEARRRFTGMDIFTDHDGKRMDALPEAQSAYDFEEVNGVTVVRNITCYGNRESRDLIIEMGVEAGIMQTMDRLDEYLASLD